MNIVEGMRTVQIHTYHSSQPFIHHQVYDTFVRNGMYGVVVDEETSEVVYRYPTNNIFCISESFEKEEAK